MEKLIINGSRRLEGSLDIQGSKNGALPVLAAALAAKGENIIDNCPDLSDITAACRILEGLGCRVKREGKTLVVNSHGACGNSITQEAMREMRSSIVFLGPMLSRFGTAEVSMPGGCDIGLRPIDLHISSLRKMGMTCEHCADRLLCKCPRHGLCGCYVPLSFPSVGATENIMLAACTARGVTVISNAAREPEISALAQYLNDCGAKISGAGERTVVIRGVECLHCARHTVIPDRIVASTYMAAAAVTGGSVHISGINAAHLDSVIQVFRCSGCKIDLYGNSLTVSAPQRLRSMGAIDTRPFPGFPTDSQPIVSAMACIASGETVINENIFENRFRHIPFLRLMGADIRTDDAMTVIIDGVDALTGANVEAQDLRAGGALIIAALAAQGTTQVTGLCHIDRGCERIEDCLTALGAEIKRMG